MTHSIKQSRPRPIALFILEGFGVAVAGDGNSITVAQTPYLDHIASHYPVAVLEAAGSAIGLDEHTPGGSEVGHTVIGTGRPWFNRTSFVNKQLDSGAFSSDAGFEQLKTLLGEKDVHIEILLSHTESEYSLKRLRILLKWLIDHGQKNIFLHCVLDGQMSSPTSGQGLVKELEKMIVRFPGCRIASLIGRLYALDNKSNKTRLQKAFSLLTKAEGNIASSASAAIIEAYEKKIFDEEFSPTVIKSGADPVIIKTNDIVIFWNYNLKNAEGLITRFAAPARRIIVFTMTDESSTKRSIPLIVLPKSTNSLGKILSAHGLKQLRLSDSAGFAAAASFFDGGETVIKQVTRRLVPLEASILPLEATLDSIQEVSRLAIKAVNEAVHDFMVVTFSQADTTAHRGEAKDVLTIIEKIDNRLRPMVEVVTEAGGISFITSSHGFVERLVDPATGIIAKDHSLNPVIFCALGKQFEGYNLGWPEVSDGDLSPLKPIGTLADIAPTILACAHLDVPPEMTGHNLIS